MAVTDTALRWFSFDLVVEVTAVRFELLLLRARFVVSYHLSSRWSLEIANSSQFFRLPSSFCDSVSVSSEKRYFFSFNVIAEVMLSFSSELFNVRQAEKQCLYLQL